MACVSICIPAYKNLDILTRLLNSIKMQTFEDYEVVITDDTRDDSVKKGIEEFLKDSRYHYYHNEKQLGASANNNMAISKAGGKYIKQMHHDDFFSFDYSLKKMIDAIENSNSDMAFAETYQVFDDRKYYRKLNFLNKFRLKRHWEYIFAKNVIGGPSATIWRNKGLLFDDKVTWLVDVEMYLRIYSKNPEITYLPEPLISIGRSDEQLSFSCANDEKTNMFEYPYLMQKYGLDKRPYGIETYRRTCERFDRLDDYWNFINYSKFKNFRVKTNIRIHDFLDRRYRDFFGEEDKIVKEGMDVK